MSETQKFYVDEQQKGVVRGGWFDDMGGILVGSSAQEVCDALNASLSPDTITNALCVAAAYSGDPSIPEEHRAKFKQIADILCPESNSS